jgi:hypothetical protein
MMRTYGAVIETLGGPRFVPGEEARVQLRLTSSAAQAAVPPEEIDISGYVGRTIMIDCDHLDDAWAWGVRGAIEPA